MSSIKRFAWAFAVLLLLSVSAKADSSAYIYFNGNVAFNNNGVGIPPYQGTMNGQNENFYCVDYSHDITGDTGWNATITALSSSSNFTHTRLDSLTTYEEIAWLLDKSQGTTDQTTQAELQWAVWSFSGGGNPYGTNSSLIGQAVYAVAHGFTDSSWEILTPTGGYGQEFMVKTPEPSSFLMLGFGIFGLMMLRRKLQTA